MQESQQYVHKPNTDCNSHLSPEGAHPRHQQMIRKSHVTEEKMMQTAGNPLMAMHGHQSVGVSMIQRQEDEQYAISPDPDLTINAAVNLSPNASLPSICTINPEFPDFYCLLVQLKKNIDQNLYNNAHHFVRIAQLYPEDSQLMEEAFFRYGLGVNLLQSIFGFTGASEGWATGLAYGTGIGLKAMDFFNNGELILDIQMELLDNVNLDLSLDLYTNPDNPLEVRGVQTGLGISGHF
ncbi:MAG: hypothetical protein AAGG59_14675 [Bacteroidota bacterium]